jgi:hypothetical protein
MHLNEGNFHTELFIYVKCRDVRIPYASDLDSNTEFGEYPWHVAILAVNPDKPGLPR